MKWLFVTNNLDAGGAERVLSSIANYLSENGREVVIIQLGDGTSFYPINQNVLIESLNLLEAKQTVLQKIIQKFKVIFLLAKKIKKHSPLAVISFIDITNILTVWASKIANTKVIVSERIHCNFLQSLFWRLMRDFTYRFASGIVVLSEIDFDYYGFVKKKKIIANPAWLLGKYSGTLKEKKILCVGRLEEQKGYDIFLKTLAQVPAPLLDEWEILILGKGTLEKELKEQSSTLGLSGKVKFLGVKKNIEEFYRRSAIFVSTSRSEGFPNALNEALSMGCACVATDCPTGPSELIVHGYNGFLAKVDDTKEICACLTKLLGSERTRQEFSKNALDSSKRYSVSNIAQQWIDFVSNVLSDS